MRIKTTGDTPRGCSLITSLFMLTYAITWLTNLVQLFNCDFEGPFKEEVVHAVGVFVPLTSFITVFY